ncbi:MAG TPA: hypothetical protein VHH73_14630 [Verrucomicrobiae bacterium]|nr:hypothetical protein [Verrucomicrobiae bacterium]
MLRITNGPAVDHRVTLQLEGRVAGPWVGELRRLCEPVLGKGHSLFLDLANVTFLDEEGVRLLQTLRAQGCQIVGASPFVIEQLKAPRVISPDA